MEEETVPQSAPSTYEWFSTNPLANSCGSALSSLYSVSKNYNRMTSWTIGTVESVVCYAADKAKPVVGAVTERLERPISAVDGIIAGGLVKLEDKYPVVGKEPSEIANEGKELIYNTFQAGQETLGNTRAGRYLGYGVDYTLAVTEGLVDKILPPLDEKEDEGESKEATKEVTSIGADDTPTEKPRSWFGLRRRKNVKKSNEDDDQEEDEQDDKVTPKKESRSTRVYNISYAVYYRSLTRLQSLQREVSCYLRRLKISLKLLEYAKSIKTGVGKQKDNVAQALKDAETKLREYLTCKPQTPPNDEFASWLTDDKEDEDIKWLLESDKKKKDVFQQALDYAKAASEKVYEMLKSLSSVTDYLPTRLRDGATAAVEQAKNVYITLKLNNVPSELPAFLLTQTVEIVETQIIFCKKVGTHISSALKQRFGYSDDTISETSSQDIAEVHLDLDEEEKMDAEEDDEKGSESEGSTE